MERKSNKCPVFPVEHGGPILGLGIFMLIVAIFSVIMRQITFLPVIIIFGGFGVFLIWLGLTK